MLRHVDYLLGGFALGAIALHDAAHISDGRWYDAFWVCNLAALLIGPAAILRSALLATVSLTWILPGTVVWLLAASVGNLNILPTSYGIHIGGTLIAGWVVWRSGRAKGSFGAALALPALAVLASRLFLPEGPNVNAAFSVPRGFSALGGDFCTFAVSATAITIALCVAGQLVCELLARAGATRAERLAPLSPLRPGA